MNSAIQHQTNGIRAVLWHQGESDTTMGTDAYAHLLAQVIRSSRTTSSFPVRWLVSKVAMTPLQIAARCGSNAGCYPMLYQRRQALWSGQELVRQLVPDVYPGISTDELDGAMRYGADITHFSQLGLNTVAALWMQAAMQSVGLQ